MLKNDQRFLKNCAGKVWAVLKFAINRKKQFAWISEKNNETNKTKMILMKICYACNINLQALIETAAYEIFIYLFLEKTGLEILCKSSV